MIAYCTYVRWRFFEIISGYLEELYFYWYYALSWKYTHSIETTEGEDSQQQKKELHDLVYQQNISYEGLFLKEWKFY